MQGIIYLITNTINNKVYVGSTTRTIDIRWSEHCRANTNSLLHKAIRKYGKEYFVIEVLKVSNDIDKDEIYYIEALDSICYGYNISQGGEGRRGKSCSDFDVVKEFCETNNITKTAKNLNTCHKRVSEVIKTCGLSTNTQEVPVKIVELNLQFSSVTECANYLLNNNYTKNKYCRNKIYDVLNGRRKTYLKFNFMVSQRKLAERLVCGTSDVGFESPVAPQL